MCRCWCRPRRESLALGLGLVKRGPIVVFSWSAASVADAWDRRKLMLMTQVGAALVSVMLAALTFAAFPCVADLPLAGLGTATVAFDLPPGRRWADARAARTPAERHHAAHDHVSDGLASSDQPSGECSLPFQVSAGSTRPMRFRSGA